ncbi:MAG: N-acyl homoserine lactonase family protein [Geminicoccaceae bacterium]
MTEERYEVFAVRYGTVAARTRRENFMGLDPHETAPMPLDYYVWVVRNEARTIVVDTGFDHAEAAHRGRRLERLPREGLALVGVDTLTVEDVIVTHLHHDHAGTLGDFPAARFHLQEAEMAYVTGACMCYPALRMPFSVEHVCEMVRNVYSGRVVFHDGDAEVAPGVTVHRLGGHSKGIQCVRVQTERGPVVLASDTAHFYENVEQGKPFIITHDVEATLRGYDRLRKLAASPAHIVPGHDPLVLQRYPALDERLAGIVCRLDVAPQS